MTVFYSIGFLSSIFPFHILQDLTASDFGATSLLDYTDRVQGIMNETAMNLPSSDGDCCRYENQILDQRCASIPFVSAEKCLTVLVILLVNFYVQEKLMTQCKDLEGFGYNNFDQRCLR